MLWGCLTNPCTTSARCIESFCNRISLVCHLCWLLVSVPWTPLPKTVRAEFQEDEKQSRKEKSSSSRIKRKEKQSNLDQPDSSHSTLAKIGKRTAVKNAKMELKQAREEKENELRPVRETLVRLASQRQLLEGTNQSDDQVREQIENVFSDYLVL